MTQLIFKITTKILKIHSSQYEFHKNICKYTYFVNLQYFAFKRRILFLSKYFPSPQSLFLQVNKQLYLTFIWLFRYQAFVATGTELVNLSYLIYSNFQDHLFPIRSIMLCTLTCRISILQLKNIFLKKI